MIDKQNPERGPVLEAGDLLAPGYEVIEHLRRGKRLDVYDDWSTERTCCCVAKTITPDRLDEDKARTKLIGRPLTDPGRSSTGPPRSARSNEWS